MIKLLVSELRAKDLVSPRYDSRKIVPGAQQKPHSFAESVSTNARVSQQFQSLREAKQVGRQILSSTQPEFDNRDIDMYPS